MTAFVLAHGAMHGAWYGDRIVPRLRERGTRSDILNSIIRELQ